MSLHIKPEYDIAIIGAGMGGMTAAAVLSKAGYSVCIIEKEPHVGGYLAGYQRKGFRFDTAIHWLNQCGPGGIVQKVFAILGNDYPRVITQKRIRRYVGASHDYLLTNNPDELKAQWIGEFPNERKGIERFFKAAKKIGAAFHDYNGLFRTEESMGLLEKLRNKIPLIKFGSAFIPYLGYTGEKGLKRGLNRFFKEEKLHKIFAGCNELIGCLVPIGWAYYKDFQSPPKGGGQVMPEWLKYLVMYYKNDIFLNSRVNNIITRDNTATGVRFNHKGNEHVVKARYVIAACDVETLYDHMLPKEVLPEKFRQKLQDAEAYSSSVTVSIALDCITSDLGFNEEMIHIANECATAAEFDDGDPNTSELSILAPSVRDASMAPEVNGTLTIYMPAYMHYKNNWLTQVDTDGNYHRNDEYYALKHAIADILIERVEKMLAPGLRSHIIFYEVATPVTHWRYTGNKNGTMMGAKPNKQNMQNKIAHYHTPVKNLLLGGHWAELGGGVPIAVKAGVNAALLVLQKENPKAFRLLADYMDAKITEVEFANANIFRSYDNSWVRKPTPAEKERAAT